MKYKTYVSLLSGLFFMSFSAVLIKGAGAPGIVTVFYRMTIGALVLAGPFIWHILRNAPAMPRKGVFIAMLAGGCFAGDMALWSTGIVASNATLPTLFANLAPLWVGLGAMAFFREKHNLLFWAGTLVAVAGMFILVGHGVSAKGNVLRGILLGGGAGLFYSFFYLLSQSGRRLLDTLTFLFVFTATASVLLGGVTFVSDYSFIGYSASSWLNFIALGVGVQVVGWFLINYAQGFLPATLVAPTLLGQPILTALWAYIFLRETLLPYQLVGGLVVVVGIYIVHYSRNPVSFFNRRASRPDK